MWLCAYLCLCVCAHTPLVCVCLPPLLCLCACGHAGMEHGHFATELNSQKRAWSWPAEQYLDCVFMRLDDHSKPYHRFVIHVCLLCSAMIRLHPQQKLLPPPTPPKRSPQKCSRHPRSEFHQPPLIVADQACSGFHSKDATLKLTASIIIHPYFSDEFV